MNGYLKPISLSIDGRRGLRASVCGLRAGGFAFDSRPGEINVYFTCICKSSMPSPTGEILVLSCKCKMLVFFFYQKRFACVYQNVTKRQTDSDRVTLDSRLIKLFYCRVNYRKLEAPATAFASPEGATYLFGERISVLAFKCHVRATNLKTSIVLVQLKQNLRCSCFSRTGLSLGVGKGMDFKIMTLLF